MGEVAGKAALYITALGQIKLYRNSHLKFINNTGRYLYRKFMQLCILIIYNVEKMNLHMCMHVIVLFLL